MTHTVRILPVAFAAATLTLLTSCLPPDEGIVRDREYEAAELDTEKRCTTRDPKTGKCTRYRTYQEFEPAEYRLYLVGNSKEGWVDVTAQEYDMCHIGETYPACTERAQL